jgi:uncharacterized protein YfiM (DUF2279 family)
MSVDERDLRMVLVAYEDAATWCEALAEVVDEWIGAARADKPVAPAALQRAARQVAETRRYLDSSRQEVRRIRQRVGLA